MPRKKSRTLTDFELRFMDVLWEKRSATVAEVVDSLKDHQRLAYVTVLTVLRILEHKGYLRHRKEGRAFVYEPLVDRETARRKEVKNVLRRFFDNSPELLVVNILEQERIDIQELKRLKQMVHEKRLEASCKRS